MARRTSRSSQITRKYNSRLLMADDIQRERKRGRATNVTRVIKVARSRSATRRLITIFRGSPHTLVRFCSHPQRAEWPGKNESAEEGGREGREGLFFSGKDRERKLPGAAHPRWVGLRLN